MKCSGRHAARTRSAFPLEPWKKCGCFTVTTSVTVNTVIITSSRVIAVILCDYCMSSLNFWEKCVCPLPHMSCWFSIGNKGTYSIEIMFPRSLLTTSNTHVFLKILSRHAAKP